MKIHKIKDKIVFRFIFILLILINIKYLFLIAQIPFTLAFVDYIPQNEFFKNVAIIKQEIKQIKDFNDEGKIGFYSDVQQANVFDIQESIKAFYIAQYAIIPNILKNDTEENYVIGYFDKKPDIPQGFSIYKKINDKTYIFKKENK